MKNDRTSIKTIEKFLKKQGATPVTGSRLQSPEYKKYIDDAKKLLKLRAEQIR